jgi:hypothetical protein
MPVSIKRKNPAAVALGRKGGKKGGPARAAKLTPEQRSESARRAVQARWGKGLSNQKQAESQSELRRLTEELQRIVFRRQYQNAENQETASLLHEASG